MDKGRNLKAGAKIALIVSLISVVRHQLVFHQTRYQLISPIIPEKIIFDIAAPHMICATISAIATIIALIGYFYSRYLFAIVTCGIALVVSEFYPIFFPG
jgi:hypothetical protein